MNRRLVMLVILGVLIEAAMILGAGQIRTMIVNRRQPVEKQAVDGQDSGPYAQPESYQWAPYTGDHQVIPDHIDSFDYWNNAGAGESVFFLRGGVPVEARLNDYLDAGATAPWKQNAPDSRVSSPDHK